MTDYKTGKLLAKLERTFILVLDEADRYLIIFKNARYGFWRWYKENYKSHDKQGMLITIFYSHLA